MGSIVKKAENYTVALQTDATSPEIELTRFTSGEIAIPTGSSITTLTYFVAMPSGTYFAAQDATPAAITQTVAATKAYPIPAALFGSALIQIRANAAGTVFINLKS
jgi:ABC-type microcin C transport system permease subunit YejB